MTGFGVQGHICCLFSFTYSRIQRNNQEENNAAGWKEQFYRLCLINIAIKRNIILLTSENRKWKKMYSPFSQNDV